MDGFFRFTLSDPDWPEVKICRILPQGDDPWGCLSFLQDTPWEVLVSVVTAESYSHATHGFLTPLMREIGDPPFHLFRRMAPKHAVCWLKQNGSCAMATEHCVPGRKTPDCYRPPMEGDWLPVAVAVEAWRKGYYVLVVEGEGFILK